MSKLAVLIVVIMMSVEAMAEYYCPADIENVKEVIFTAAGGSSSYNGIVLQDDSEINIISRTWQCLGMGEKPGDITNFEDIGSIPQDCRFAIDREDLEGSGEPSGGQTSRRCECIKEYEKIFCESFVYTYSNQNNNGDGGVGVPKVLVRKDVE